MQVRLLQVSSEAVHKLETSHVRPSVVHSSFLSELGEADILARWRRILEGRLPQIVAQLAPHAREGIRVIKISGIKAIIET